MIKVSNICKLADKDENIKVKRPACPTFII